MAVLEQAGLGCEVLTTGDRIRCQGQVSAHAKEAVRAAIAAVGATAHFKPEPSAQGARRLRWKSVSGGQSGTPSAQRQSYGIPASTVITNPASSAMVWGPGTYGFASSDLGE